MPFAVQASMNEQELVAGLVRGNSQAFATAVKKYHSPLVRLARKYVASTAVAEEVVQDVWAAVFKGIHRFEGRSSLKTWIFRILVNRAHTTGAREKRYFPVSTPARSGEDGPLDLLETLLVRAPTTELPETPERTVYRIEEARIVRQTMERLPTRQREVVEARDLRGLDAAEVCELMDLSEANQRVLLHRGRQRLARELATTEVSRAA